MKARSSSKQQLVQIASIKTDKKATAIKAAIHLSNTKLLILAEKTKKTTKNDKKIESQDLTLTNTHKDNTHKSSSVKAYVGLYYCSNIGYHFNVDNVDIPLDLIPKILGFLDMSSFQSHLQLQLISKRWFLTSTDPIQEIWHSFLFKFQDEQVSKPLDLDRFKEVKNIKFFVAGDISVDDNISSRISKHNHLEYLCIEGNTEASKGNTYESVGKELKIFENEDIVEVLMSTINTDNLQQLCLCGLRGFNLLEYVQFQGLLSIFITGCYVSDDILVKISLNSPLLRDLILSNTTKVYHPPTLYDDDGEYSDDGNTLDSYSNIGVTAILQNCTALECLELGGERHWDGSNSLLNKDMFINMSCSNLKRVAFGNLNFFDDDAIKVLCDNVRRLEEFMIDEGSLTTNTGIFYLIEKYSGSLTLFIDSSHRFSAEEIFNFAVILDHIHEFEVEGDRYTNSTKCELITKFKNISTSNELKRVEIGIPGTGYKTTGERPFSLLSFWDSMERRIQPDDSKWKYFEDEQKYGEDSSENDSEDSSKNDR
jgi:hypothetical protein